MLGVRWLFLGIWRLMSLIPSTRVHLPRPFQWRKCIFFKSNTPIIPWSSRRTAHASLIIVDPMPSSPMISSPRLSRDSTPSSVVASLSPSPEFIPLISACILPSFPHFYIQSPRVVNGSTDESLPLSAYIWLASSSASACWSPCSSKRWRWCSWADFLSWCYPYQMAPCDGRGDYCSWAHWHMGYCFSSSCSSHHLVGMLWLTLTFYMFLLLLMFLDFTTLVVRVLWILLICHLPRLLYLLPLATHGLQLSLPMAFELAHFCLLTAMVTAQLFPRRLLAVRLFIPNGCLWWHRIFMLSPASTGGISFPFLLLLVSSLVSGSTRLRLMILLNFTKLV